MAHYANNQYGFRRICFRWVRTEVVRYPKLFSYRVFFAEGLLRENIIDDSDEFFPYAVLVIEEASFEQRNTHHLQVVRRNAGCQAQWHLVSRRSGWSAPIAALFKAETHWYFAPRASSRPPRPGAGTIQRVLPSRAYA